VTDERDLKDPSRNYTVPFNQPIGMRIPEHVFRQLIGYGLKQIRESLDNPVNLVSELFAMTGEDVVAQVKSWLREHTNIFLGVSWPKDDVSLPLITVINQGEQEDVTNAFLGDATGAMEYGKFGDVRPSAREQRAIPMRHTTNIYVASQDDALTLYLYNIVRFILVSNKDALTQWYDIHNLVVSGQPLEFDEKLFPIFGYYRLLQLQYTTFFDYNLSEEAAKIVSLELLVEALLDGEVRVVVEVPES